MFEFDDRYSSECLEKKFEDSRNIEETTLIRATLHSGLCTDGKWLEKSTRFSMFGTERAINEFSLKIYPVDKKENQSCNVFGCVGFEYERDFSLETIPDSIEINLGLSRERFNKLANLISDKKIDVMTIGISDVSGFYAESSPSIFTDSVKVLSGTDQEIDIPEGCEIKPPKLGSVSRFELTLITRSKLDLKQNFTTLSISELFEDDCVNHEREDESENVNNLLLANIAENQYELIKLKTP